MKKIKGLLFDLDGVLVDTAKYHFVAWKQLAQQLDITFTEDDNERLKGVSRMRSFEIILEIGGVVMEEDEKLRLCEQKNNLYVEYIKQLRQDEILPGAREFLENAKRCGYKTALGSASKNSSLILARLGIADLLDVVVDGTLVSQAKPDPEVFIKGAQRLGFAPEECIVFEDAVAGIEAAHRGGMFAVGIGTPARLPQADIVIPGLNGVTIEWLVTQLHLVEGKAEEV